MARVRSQARPYTPAKPRVKKTDWRQLWALGVIPLTFDRVSMTIGGLIIGVLLSAFALIYVKNVNRNLTEQLNSAQSQQHQLHDQWENLLLRKMQLKNEKKIADIATHNLQMKLPSPKETTIMANQ